MKRVLYGVSGLVLSFAFVLPVSAQTVSSSTVTLDATTTAQLAQVISATRTLLNTIQAQLAQGMYSTQQRFALASTLNSIGSISANISSRLGGNVATYTPWNPSSILAAAPVSTPTPGFPNTGEAAERRGMGAGLFALLLAGAAGTYYLVRFSRIGKEAA